MQREEEQKRFERFGRWFEAAQWLLAAGFGWLAWTLGDQIGDARQARLFGIAAALAATAILYYRLMPDASPKALRYEPEDKILLTSITLFALITAGLYSLGRHQESLVFLYLLPMLASTMLLDEKLIIAESSLATMAVTFLHAATRLTDGIFQVEFVSRLAVFFGVSMMLVFLTGELRKTGEKASRLVRELSTRLDQIQVVSILVRQIEIFSDPERLLRRITEIVASAFGAERCGFLMPGPSDRALRLRAECCGLTDEEKRRLEGAEAERVFNPVFENGSPRVFETGADGTRPLFRSLMAAPLSAHNERLGVIFVADKRDGVFSKPDLEFLEMLGGYIAALIDSSMLFQKLLSERETASRMTRLLVGRELRMKELKRKLEGDAA